MAITSQDIHNQSFAIDRKGYDVDEVDVFLEHVVDEIDFLNDQIAQLQNELMQAREAAEQTAGETAAIASDTTDIDISEISDGEMAGLLAEKDAIIKGLEEQLADKQANDNAISQALIIAQRSADEIIVKANAQASETMQDAREEADRIINRANADKQGVVDDIHKLEDDREETREGYADLLRDFIEDASRKLNELGYDDDIDSIPGIGRDAGQVDVVYDEAAAVNYIPAEAAEQVTAAPVAPLAPGIEKDLSGFGDVEDDFEDVD